MREMVKMIPRGYLSEAGEPFWKQLMGAAHEEDGKKSEFSKMFAYDVDGVARAFKKSYEEGMKEWKDMRLAYKNHLKQVYGITAPSKVEEAVETFKGYDVHHTPDGVMVLVYGPDDAAQDMYYGINVVFGKKGSKPELVTSDDLADDQARKYKAQIIAAAEKRLGKEEKDYLASL